MIESERLFSGVTELFVVLPVVIAVFIPVDISVVMSVVISDTFISVVLWSVVLLYIESDVGTVTSFIYNQIK